MSINLSSSAMIVHSVLFIGLTGWYLISSNGYLMHGVVDRLEQLQHGVQSLLEFTAVLLLRTVLQQLLHRDTKTQVDRSVSFTLSNLLCLDVCLPEGLCVQISFVWINLVNLCLGLFKMSACVFVCSSVCTSCWWYDRLDYLALCDNVPLSSHQSEWNILFSKENPDWPHHMSTYPTCMTL